MCKEIEKSPGQQLNDRDDIDFIVDMPWVYAISEEDLQHTLSENEKPIDGEIWLKL